MNQSVEHMINKSASLDTALSMPSLIQIRNGEKVKPTFSAQEYQNRQQKLKAYMAKSDIDSVLFTSYHNINYYADFLYCSFGRFYGLVINQDKVEHQRLKQIPALSIEQAELPQIANSLRSRHLC